MAQRAGHRCANGNEGARQHSIARGRRPSPAPPSGPPRGPGTAVHLNRAGREQPLAPPGLAGVGGWGNWTRHHLDQNSHGTYMYTDTQTDTAMTAYAPGRTPPMPAHGHCHERACPEYGGLSQPARAGQLTGLGLPGVPAYMTTPWGGSSTLACSSQAMFPQELTTPLTGPPARARTSRCGRGRECRPRI